MEKKLDSKKTYNWQKFISFFLLAFFIVMILQWIFADYYKGAGQTIILFWIFGGLLGYLLSRCRFGFLGPIKRLVNNGDGRQARLMILMMTLSTLIAGFIIAGFGTTLAGNASIGLGVILGGFVFGLAMVFAGGCASGILTDGGKGTLGAFIVIIFFSLGAFIGAILNVYTSELNFLQGDGTNYSNLSSNYGWLIGIIINLVLFSILLVVIKLVEIKKQKTNPLYIKQDVRKTENNVETDDKKNFWQELYYKAFVEKWSWHIGAILLALWFGAYISATKGTSGVAGGYTNWGAWILWLFGYHDLGIHGLVINNKEVISAAKISAGPLKDTGAMFNLSIIIGAMFYFLSSNNFKFGRPKTWLKPIILAVAGLGMGIGAKIAGGCNLGAMWFGISVFKGSGWFFTIFMVIGAVLGLCIQRKVTTCRRD
ncbi:YeeE/YedE family protein [Spiroplasma alleghenense]|uniref:Uncharacterized protein n=1 Tax=Spiroplasma alleghenense TaxID=216931 RepID=A0A345Z2P4_9MOLU|nr:YeeE/YedE family protein [Spiroplasma alleghenense]AXK50873.1 hypothetical protein SALLE_v1c01970 [Spiroplasma alleghenense]